TQIPVLEYGVESDKLTYRWANVVPGFAMPVRATVGSRGLEWLCPTTTWKTFASPVGASDSVHIDANFLVTSKRVGGVAGPSQSGAPSESGASAPGGLEALWYSTGSETSMQSFLAHASEISIVSPQVFRLEANGDIRGHVDP